MGLSFVAKLVKMLWETKITRDPPLLLGHKLSGYKRAEHVEV